MNAENETQSSRVKNSTAVERKSDREIVVTRIFNAPVRIVCRGLDYA